HPTRAEARGEHRGGVRVRQEAAGDDRPGRLAGGDGRRQDIHACGLAGRPAVGDVGGPQRRRVPDVLPGRRQGRRPGPVGRAIRGSLFGPPPYVAAEVIATAYKVACADGTASRAELLQSIRAVRLPRTILGIPVTFDGHGEVPAARYYVSQIQRNGKHKVVW